MPLPQTLNYQSTFCPHGFRHSELFTVVAVFHWVDDLSHFLHIYKFPAFKVYTCFGMHQSFISLFLAKQKSVVFLIMLSLCVHPLMDTWLGL